MFNGTDVFWIARPYGARYEYMRCQMDSLLPGSTHILAREKGNVWVDGKVIHTKRRGCLRAHVTAIREARERMRKTGRGHALIFEDDVSVEEGVSLDRPSITHLVSSLPSWWDVVQLGYHAHREEWDKLLRGGGGRQLLTVKKRGRIWALLAYLISRKAADVVWNNTRVEEDGTVRVLVRCGSSADDCIMNGKVAGRAWKAWIATPPLFWEGTKTGNPPLTLFTSTVGSNSQMHAESSIRGSTWARGRYTPHQGARHPECKGKVRTTKKKRQGRSKLVLKGGEGLEGGTAPEGEVAPPDVRPVVG